MNNLDDYKIQVNLAEYAMSKGFRIVKNKSGRNIIRLQHPDGTELKVWRNKNNFWRYLNINNDSDTGTIIDFLQNRMGLNFGLIRRELEVYLKRASFQEHAYMNTEAKRSFSQTEVSALQLTDVAFLLERGFREKTIHSRLFKGTIFNQEKKIGNYQFSNIVFPLYSKDGYCGLDIRNKNYKGSAPGSDKQNGIWISKFDRSNPLENVYIFESPLDALAHYELLTMTHAGFDENICYIATGGNLNPGQIKTIGYFLTKAESSSYFIRRITLCFDNDQAGMFFRCAFLAQADNQLLKNPEHKPLLDYPVFVSRENDELVIEFLLDTHGLENAQETVQKLFYSVFGNIHGVEPIFMTDKETLKVHIELENKMKYLERAAQFILQLRFGENSTIGFEQSFFKDFNEDLLARKKYKKK